MVKALVIIVLVVLFAFVTYWLYASHEIRQAITQPWPAELGTLATFAERFPPQSESEAATRVKDLAIDVASAGAGEYVRREVETADQAIGEPPAHVAAFLTRNAAHVAALRQHLLADQPIVWARDIRATEPTPQNLKELLDVMRALVASALVRARANDAGAWDDLHAAWNVARSLHAHPDMVSQMIALAGARMINAVAWKMPAPAPAWRSQMEETDHVRLMLRAMQYEEWIVWTRAGKRPGAAKAIDGTRRRAERLAAITDCDVDAGKVVSGPSPNLGVMWRRVFRYRAELEATRYAIARRAGPSRCSDGTWSFDGTELRFSREISQAATSDRPMPLRLRLHSDR